MPADPRLVARIVWCSLLAAVALYHVVLRLLPGGAAGADASVVVLLRPLFVSLAAALTLAALLVHRRALAPALERPAANGGRLDPPRALSLYVVCWALAGAIAVLGFALGVVGGTPEPTALFLVWSAAALVYLRPRDELLRPGDRRDGAAR